LIVTINPVLVAQWIEQPPPKTVQSVLVRTSTSVLSENSEMMCVEVRSLP